MLVGECSQRNRYSLVKLYIDENELTSVPAKIGQLTSLEWLYLSSNQLRSVPAEIGQLTPLWVSYLDDNQLTSVPAAISERGAVLWAWIGA